MRGLTQLYVVRPRTSWVLAWHLPCVTPVGTVRIPTRNTRDKNSLAVSHQLFSWRKGYSDTSSYADNTDTRQVTQRGIQSIKKTMNQR